MKTLENNMATYERGDYVKVKFPDKDTGVGEWTWVRVEVCDDKKKQIIGRLDNEPLNDYEGKLEQGAQLVVSYAQIREHRKPTEFTKNSDLENPRGIANSRTHEDTLCLA